MFDVINGIIYGVLFTLVLVILVSYGLLKKKRYVVVVMICFGGVLFHALATHYGYMNNDAGSLLVPGILAAVAAFYSGSAVISIQQLLGKPVSSGLMSHDRVSGKPDAGERREGNAARTEELNQAFEALRKKEKEIFQELELAGTIQRGILPAMPYSRDGVIIDAYYQSMFQIGGDFYDVFRMPGGFIGVLMADVSGHGMPAAFITALAKISFSEAIQRYLFPSEIFCHVNMDLINTVKTDDYVTAFLVVISPSREVFYCNASHQKAMVFRRETGAVDQWDTDGLFLGYSEEANNRYRDGIDNLAYGDRLILYTDGVTEGKNSERRAFGEEPLKQILIETVHLPLSQARNTLVEKWKKFKADAVIEDDATFMMLELDPQHEEFSYYRDKGFNALNRGDISRAITELDKALAMNNDDEQANLFMGEACLFAGKFVEAARYLEFYISHNKFDAEVWHHLAEAWFNLDNYEGALFAARKAVKLKPNYYPAMMILAKSYEQTGNAKEALREWQRIIGIDPQNPEAREGVQRLS